MLGPVPVTSPHELDLGLAIGLGIVQGIAEFLPISSSGHLSLVQTLFGVDAEHAGHRFNIVAHAGTLLAVLWVYRYDLASLFRGALLTGERRARQMVLAVIVGTFPLAFALTSFVGDAVKSAEGDLRIIGACFLATACALAFSHRRQLEVGASSESPTEGAPINDESSGLKHALLIGFAQVIAVLPGVSRSGSTIAASLALGHTRAQSARFSFLLSIPAICGASAKELLDLWKQSQLSETSGVVSTHGPGLEIFATGFVVSFVVGLVSLRVLLGILQRYGLLPFVPYLAIAGGLCLIFG